MANMEPLDQEAFETNVRQTLQKLSDLVEQYDQQDKESEVAQFSKHDPLKNLILGLASKIRSEENLGADESLEKADDVVRQAEQEVNKPGVKQRICASLKGFTGDSLQLLPILLELAKAGFIVVTFDPTGTFLVSAACLLIVRVGLESFCAD